MTSKNENHPRPHTKNERKTQRISSYPLIFSFWQLQRRTFQTNHVPNYVGWEVNQLNWGLGETRLGGRISIS
jgi:hypothetical protein